MNILKFLICIVVGIVIGVVLMVAICNWAFQNLPWRK